MGDSTSNSLSILVPQLNLHLFYFLILSRVSSLAYCVSIGKHRYLCALLGFMQFLKLCILLSNRFTRKQFFSLSEADSISPGEVMPVGKMYFLLFIRFL